jgi:hypothetical protein
MVKDCGVMRDLKALSPPSVQQLSNLRIAEVS